LAKSALEHPSRTRIADVAREAGVSKAAVSFAFNYPDRLRPETAERIRQIASQLGYRPHPVARMLTARSTATIGIVSPQALAQVFANPFFALFSEGVASVTEEHGFGLLFISPLKGSIERALARATVDGVIVIGLDRHHPEVESIRRAGLPTVLVDAPAWPEHGAIEVDDTSGALAAARHIFELGHREILILTIQASDLPEEVGGVATRRLAGYEQAFRDAGAKMRDGWVRYAPPSFGGGEVTFLEAWHEGLRPTAVLSMSDAAAAGVLQAARSLGLSVPADLSVVGFDDLPVTQFTDPPLTTVHQPVRRKGEEAAAMLLEAIGTGASGEAAVEHRTLETRLIVRGSTAPVRPRPA
jgi:alanine racemase